MDERIPEPIRPFLQDYIRLLGQQLGDLLQACYLYGSLALGAFNERMSDIDFITVLGRSPTSSDIVQLQAIHQNLRIAYPRWTLDGSYLQWHDFGCLPDAVIPYPYVAQGIFHPQGYRDLNLVTWWVLKHHGIALLGSSPQTLSFTVSWDELVARMYENLNSYWLSWTRTPTRLAQLLTDYGIQWAVLGILRLWYALPEESIKVQLQGIIDRVTADKPTLAVVISRLQKAGVEVKTGFTRTGKPKGISYQLKGVAFAGNQLGKAYSFTGLQKHRGVQYNRSDNSLIQELVTQLTGSTTRRTETPPKPDSDSTVG